MNSPRVFLAADIIERPAGWLRYFSPRARGTLFSFLDLPFPKKVAAMRKMIWSAMVVGWIPVIGLMAAMTGCDSQEASKALESAEQNVAEAGEKISEGTAEMVEKGKEAAANLSDEAMAMMTPLKEKFGDLDQLKDKPEELKARVSELIEWMETKAESIELPESVSTALASTKEKLVQLKEYLQGEYEDAEVDKYIQEIKESAGSMFDFS
ncbi:hypothetical protein [Crateriforma conspicua]|uniref:Uncharacterized protein n=1 Tax=Crateriforma conspicua TaxID=2527996 RepID=A0A5C5Y2K9_9PLAN|nr:hypothetical protein [Crateriforma conspicua]TWT68903.1 hypothetical protein Pan14r_11860 [Crateriforma conspicua]